MTLNYLIEKEFKQLFRNILLPVVFVLLPIGLMNMVPRLATQEVKGLKFAVVDKSHTSLSRQLINKIDASNYLSLTCYAPSYAEAMHSIDSGDADVIIEIPKGYPKESSLALYANSTNGTRGSMASMYVTQIAADALCGDSEIAALPASVRFMFNTCLDYKIYMIPAIFALELMLIVGFLPALNIVGEKEKGTIEQINVSPIGKIEFVVSKIVPYVVVGLFMSIESLVAAKALYDITPAGSILTMLLFIAVFCMLVSSLGLIASNYSNTIQQAALTMFFFLVIFILMSGLLTPIDSMPRWAQLITYANPMRYFIEAIRFIYLKGSTLSQLMPQLTALSGYAILGWAVAIASYRKNS